jgi:hypothetical protein
MHFAAKTSKSLTDRMKITAQIKGLGRQDEAGMMA